MHAPEVVAAEQSLRRLRVRMLMFFGSLYLASITTLISLNERESNLVGWAVDSGFNPGDVLWISRLLPAMIGCVCPIALFITQWHIIDFKQHHDGLSASKARVQAYSLAATAGVLFLFVVHLVNGGPP